MGKGQKFQQQWEFRRRDSHFGSSSDEPKSSDSGEPLFKKHKMVSNWIPPKTDEAGDISRLQQKVGYTPDPGSHFRNEKSNQMKIESSRKEDPVYGEMRERPSYRKDDRKKRKSSAHEPATLNSTRVFMESILEELKVARENMFIWMREEMRKVMGDDATPGPTVREDRNKQEIIEATQQTSFELGSDVRNCNGNPLVGSVKRKRTIKSRTGYGAEYCQSTLSMTSTETDSNRFGSSVKGPSSSVSPSDLVGSCMYLTLPSALPEACVENPRFNSPSYNYQTRLIENGMALIGKTNPMLDSSNHHGSFLGDQEEEKFGNIAHRGSQNLGYIGQNKLALGSGSGFPVPFRHGLDGAFKIQTQASVQDLSQVQENILGLSMNGGMRSIAGGHGLSELYVANNLHNNVNSEAKGATWTQSNSIPRSRRGLVRHDLVYQE